MDFVTRTLRIQRALLAAVLVGSALGFSRSTYDVFNTVKATVVVVGALALLAVSAVRVSRTRRVVWPVTPAWSALGLFAAGLVAATAVSPTTLAAVVGRLGRHTGLALYLTYVVLFVAALRLYRDASPVGLVTALLVAAAPVTVYGLAQAAGLEPLSWQAVEGGPQVFATFGNANFFAAWLGAVVPLCAWAALSRAVSPGARAGAAVLGVGAAVAAYASHSLQGPAAATAGLAVVAVAALGAGDERSRRRAPLLLAAGGALAVAAGVALAAGVGPLAAIRTGALTSLDTRVGKWQAALAMWADHPLLGVGLDGYADWYHRYRSAEVAAESGLARTADTAHNVVLDLLASGGLLLALSYLAVVGFTGWALVGGLRRLRGEDRLLLGGLGGAWVAYQVQSLVSIDVPPLAALHWVLAGTIVALATSPTLRTWTLPGAPALPEQRPGGGKRRARPQPQPLVPANPVLLTGVALATAGALWLALLPVRAEAAAGRASAAVVAGRTDEALASYARAGRLAPWEARYPTQAAGFLAELRRPEQALVAHERAAARAPRALAHPVNIGRLAAQLGDHGKAGAAYARVLELDPKTPEVLVEVGRYRLARGDLAGATALLERAVSAQADNAEWWLVLGQARNADGDTAGARQAYQRALDLEPTSADAAGGPAGGPQSPPGAH
jgi:O-antigen ligase/Tfp pilus assembly protein PilF